MDLLWEFLGSSTIHGLAHISDSKSRVGKVIWTFIVIIAFLSAGYLINSSYEDWNQSPVTTSISTPPINQLKFPMVTVCPAKGSNTALNYDLARLKNQGGNNRSNLLMSVVKDIFL